MEAEVRVEEFLPLLLRPAVPVWLNRPRIQIRRPAIRLQILPPRIRLHRRTLLPPRRITCWLLTSRFPATRRCAIC